MAHQYDAHPRARIPSLAVELLEAIELADYPIVGVSRPQVEQYMHLADLRSALMIYLRSVSVATRT